MEIWWISRATRDSILKDRYLSRVFSANGMYLFRQNAPQVVNFTSAIFLSQTVLISRPNLAPCELLPIPHGQYLSGYRAGLTIANGSFINYQCDREFVKVTAAPTECFRGELLPKKPACKRGEWVAPDFHPFWLRVGSPAFFRGRAKIFATLRENTNVKFVKLLSSDPALYTTGSDIYRSTELGSMDLLSGLRGSCGPPARIQGSLVFRNGEPLSDTERRYADSVPHF